MMFNKNTPWKRPNDSCRIHAICLSCIILLGRIATAQGIFPNSDAVDPRLSSSLSQMGASMAGERIASVTCDPFMTASQEQTLMRLLQEQDAAPWLDFSLNNLRDHLLKVCT